MALAGTRPEAVKQAPIVLAAAGREDLQVLLVHTGQHDGLFQDGLAPFGIKVDHALRIDPHGHTPDALVECMRAILVPLLVEVAPDMVVVQGDTSSALAGALAANALGVPLAHVEAGLRTGDPHLPWPEETNRITIARLADLHFAPSERAARNLADEGVPGRIHVVGNTGIDALLIMRDRVPARLGNPGETRILVTAHRREIIGAPLDRVAMALRAIVAGGFGRRVTIIRHDNPAGAQLQAAFCETREVEVLAPVGFAAMIALLRGADLVLSDSGGLQEECAALGVPLLVLRDNTERPEVVECGAARLVGTGTREIVDAAEAILTRPELRHAMSVPRFPYGEGDAAVRIVDLIAAYPFP